MRFLRGTNNFKHSFLFEKTKKLYLQSPRINSNNDKGNMKGVGFCKQPEEKIEQVIFKLGNGITVCVSFFASSGIDALFDDAINILCAELSLSRGEILEKVNLEATKEKVRLIAVKDMIRRSTEMTGDAYEIVEYLSDTIPALKELRESDETYQRNKNIRLQHAGFLANFMKYEEALKIFNRFRKDPEVAFKIFLCHLAMKESFQAEKIANSTLTETTFTPFMKTLYRNYIEKDVQSFLTEIKNFDKDLGVMKDAFIVTMLLRIKTIISE